MPNYINDKTLREGLHMLLLHQSPKDIMESWRKENDVFNNSQSAWLEIPGWFPRRLTMVHPTRFSMGDARQVEAILRQCYFQVGKRGVFDCFFDFTNQTLLLDGNEAVVRFDELLRWRDTVHPIGPIPFLAAYLAQQDIKEDRYRVSFAMNPVLSTDNGRLKKILSNGIAENHFHLKGSAPSFMISWINLMNRPAHLWGEIFKLDDLLGESVERTPMPLSEQIALAVSIRVFLFCLLHKERGFTEQSTIVSQCFNYLNAPGAEAEIEHISALQHMLGSLWIEGLEHSDNYLDLPTDYALSEMNYSDDKVPYLIYAGELRFQYQMFSAIYHMDPDLQPYFSLFYAYLVIQCQFRREMIENDHRFGLENFTSYDRRKGTFLTSPEDRAVQQSIPAAAALYDKRVQTLEARIVPSAKKNGLANQIKNLDYLIERYVQHDLFAPDLEILETRTMDQILQKIHYILHFPKRKDTLCKGKDGPCFPISSYSAQFPQLRDVIMYRYQYYRQDLEKAAKAIVDLREGDPDTANRIVGIDACGNELNARPEVFAPVFRRLKSHRTCSCQNAVSDLRVTYHVGEDFLDVVDGLRAIWEAKTFLELRRMDRMGHGLVLGVDIEAWYNAKQRRIYLSKQDLLDNCVWLIKYLQRYGDIISNLQAELVEVCSNLYTQIYRNAQDIQMDVFSLDQYWLSMQLRGDAPTCYRNVLDWKRYLDDLNDIQIRKPFALRDDYQSSFLYSDRRSQHEAVKLYYAYHYSFDVKNAGAESVEFHVSQNFIQGAKQAQTILKNQIAQLGIGIETNPSSNVLIGNFNRYDAHPIFALNDHGLFDRPGVPNLSVSINTDDQGVFDTSLENEYALIARALEQAVDENGQPLVDHDHIYSWLDHVREMGIQQSFA